MTEKKDTVVAEKMTLLSSGTVGARGGTRKSVLRKIKVFLG